MAFIRPPTLSDAQSVGGEASAGCRQWRLWRGYGSAALSGQRRRCICGAQAAAHRRWRGVGGAFRRAGGWTRGDGASIGRGCAFRGRVEASTRQPAVEQETTAAAAKATARAMATESRALPSETWRRPPWSLRLRLCPHSLRTTPMTATSVSPLSAALLSRRGVG